MEFNMNRFSKILCCVLLVGMAAISFAAIPPSFKVLHTFTSEEGSAPNSLALGSDGFFYGSAANGGDVNSCAPDGCGTIFKTDSAGNLSVLHTFHATDGYLPTGLVEGSDGNFYGTTASGGQPSGGGAGTFFRIDSSGNFSVLYAFVGGFACCDGAGPAGKPVLASDGNFYGATGAGGQFRDIDHQGGFGTIYQFNPLTGVLTILHSFNLADGNGIFPNGPLVQASDGFLYGTTREGGPTAFKIDTAGNFSRVAVLSGMQPLSGLIQANDGFFYGTDEGVSGGGTVYRLSASGKVKIINAFDGADGWRPAARLFQNSDGTFYGITPQGGLLDFQGGDIFRVNARGALSILHSFLVAGTEGFIPIAELIQGNDGVLYGTNGLGGSNNHGTFFRFDQRVPGIISSITVDPTIIHSRQTSTGTVKLSRNAPAGGVVVVLGALQGQIVIPASVTVPAGSRTATFSIKALNIGAKVNVRIYASFSGQGVRKTITVEP